jgi:hypothetical protein
VPGRGREVIRLTPFLLAAVLAAMVATALVIVFWYLDTNGPPPGSPAGAVPPTGSRHRANLVVAVGAGVAAWLAVLLGACYDLLLRHIDRLGDRLEETAARLTLEAEQQGVFRGIAIEAERSAPRPGDPPDDDRSPDDPPTGGGGRILPFRP